MKLQTIEIIVLVDNCAKTKKLQSEHGIAYWIKTKDSLILFDTGQGVALPGNSQRMRISFSQCRAIVFSHGHYDHTGAAEFALKMCPEALVYIHPDVMKTRYGFKPGHPVKSIGIPLVMRQALNRARKRIRWVRRPVQIANGIWATGPIPRVSSFEDVGGNFFNNFACTKKDTITDDQAVWVETDQGLIVLLGCGHSGVVNTLDYISKLTNRAPIFAVLGGMHLLNVSRRRLTQTVCALKRYRIRWILPGHCTGDIAMNYLKQKFKSSFRKLFVGMQFPFVQKIKSRCSV